MKRFLQDFMYYLKCGYSIRRAWHLTRVTVWK
jgi:hypothetical protein